MSDVIGIARNRYGGIKSATLAWISRRQEDYELQASLGYTEKPQKPEGLTTPQLSLKIHGQRTIAGGRIDIFFSAATMGQVSLLQWETPHPCYYKQC